MRNAWQSVKRYFNLLDDREDEQAVVDQVSAGVVFRGTNLWILMFAILIASLGLNVNSTAVIIGAMLISPLMGPIIGMGLSVGIGDYDLLRRALKNYGVATLISVLTAALYFLISPLSEARSELLARTTPTLYDVLIAFCGGAAGVLALTTKSKGQVIPGVAIATALMPPLCTAGYGLATAQWTYFFGAFYLFFINTVFIALSTFLGVKLLRFHSKQSLAPEVATRGKRMVAVVVVVAMLPAALMTVNIVRSDVVGRHVAQFVENELAQPGTSILSHEVVHDTLHVVAIGRPIDDGEIASARSRMGHYKLGSMILEVIQGSDNDDLATLMQRVNTMADGAMRERSRLTAQVSDLEGRLSAYTAYDSLSAQTTREAATLFPAVENIGMASLGGEPTALVRLHGGRHMAQAERDKLAAWLRTRAGSPALEVIFR